MSPDDADMTEPEFDERFAAGVNAVLRHPPFGYVSDAAAANQSTYCAPESPGDET